jgi:AcrR family transcriptional regulator
MVIGLQEASMAKTDKRAKIVEAFMVVLEESDWQDVTMPMISARAGLPLSELRAEFDGKLAILAAFARHVDVKVLEGMDAAMQNEPAKDRLFDVLMRRFDVLTPHKSALRSLRKTLRREPGLIQAFMPIAVRSHRWMLQAAEIETGGMRGEIAARGLAVSFARVVDVWIDDEDAGLAATMAALDKRLEEGARIMRRIEDAERVAAPFRAICRSLMEARPFGRRRERRNAQAA